jgi:hypothetical protein
MTNDEFEKYILEEHARWDWSLIPSHMWNGVKTWVEHGVEGGSFLQSIMEHDFYNAIFRADNMNKACITGWAEFICWYLPSTCHGSVEDTAAWSKIGGLRGLLIKDKK